VRTPTDAGYSANIECTDPEVSTCYGCYTFGQKTAALTDQVFVPGISASPMEVAVFAFDPATDTEYKASVDITWVPTAWPAPTACNAWQMYLRGTIISIVCALLVLAMLITACCCACGHCRCCLPARFRKGGGHARLPTEDPDAQALA